MGAVPALSGERFLPMSLTWARLGQMTLALAAGACRAGGQCVQCLGSQMVSMWRLCVGLRGS